MQSRTTSFPAVPPQGRSPFQAKTHDYSTEGKFPAEEGPGGSYGPPPSSVSFPSVPKEAPRLPACPALSRRPSATSGINRSRPGARPGRAAAREGGGDARAHQPFRRELPLRHDRRRAVGCRPEARARPEGRRRRRGQAGSGIHHDQ
jgi:hypothetical protein